MSLLIKSKIDQRLYKSFILPNKLSCLLISDKDTEKSAAALNVNVGALEDPTDVLYKIWLFSVKVLLIFVSICYSWGQLSFQMKQNIRNSSQRIQEKRMLTLVPWIQITFFKWPTTLCKEHWKGSPNSLLSHCLMPHVLREKWKLLILNSIWICKVISGENTNSCVG